MDAEQFKKYGYELIDWVSEYFQDIETYPVKSQVSTKEILSKLPTHPPQDSEDFEKIFKDFNKIIMPGITHWQSPNFFAYFPANNSFPSILGELLTSALGTQCMIWETSPAAAELEEVTMKWLAEMIGIPETFSGVIQDTASTATLCSILTAREKYSENNINENGFANKDKFVVYCSSEAHSSIEKAVKIAGIGKKHLRKIAVDKNYAMNTDELEIAINKDLKNDFIPLCVVGALGTTGATAIDPISKIGEICRKYKIWYHVDAAFAGTALILPEMRWMSEGIELADTFVFNPHKWMFTNFDCSAYFVKDRDALIKTFEIMPEYLKTGHDSQVNNYRDWGIQLGRRFRALKLWFVLRSFGVKNLQEKIRFHLKLASDLVIKIKQNPDFEILAPVHLNLLCFRYNPANLTDKKILNRLNDNLLTELNHTGKIYLTHTKLNDNFAIRMCIGQTNVTEKHISDAWELIQNKALEILEKYK
ncbi:MAG: aminotransferase class V-fold PLP-dependent enzyme [FCB group bacterium]|jgi:aromatic-L-amino-acid decarboxylase